MTTIISKHFVEFFSPGTFTAETSLREVSAWNVDEALKIVASITERHGATPYGFRFITRERGPDDLDSKIAKKSGTYFLGGKIETLADLEARNDPREEILRGNMRCNGRDRIVTNTNSWKWTQELDDGDVVLDYTPPPRKEDSRG